ncbi:hypothetical protein FDB69_15715 [Clostridium botulinum]|nr:hypothetical protein [Clostridium sp. DSM 1985]NFL46725.1 hypothetical protein [Clostridium botulinum]NFL91175.1 hypothetical protein [Clostridium botulinum]
MKNALKDILMMICFFLCVLCFIAVFYSTITYLSELGRDGSTILEYFILFLLFGFGYYYLSKQKPKTITINCPYCKKKYTMEDGYYMCKCKNYFRKEGNKVYREDETVTNLIQNLLILMTYISKADGIIATECEIKILKEIINSIELNNTQVEWCIRIFNKYKTLPYDKNVIHLLNESLKSEQGDSEYNKQIKTFCLSSALSIANANGGSTYNQNLIIRDIISILEIPLTEYESLKKDTNENIKE